MKESNTIEFIPEGELPSQNRKWSGLLLINIFVIVIWHFVIQNKYPYDAGTGWVFAGLILIPIDSNILFFSQDPVKVTLIKDTGIFQYDYTDFWGNEKSRTIYLKTAYYKYARSSNYIAGSMRLLMYNNYFKNQVVIRASDKIGFTRGQLDAIVDCIKNIQDKL